MRAGRLDRRVTLQRRTVTRDSYGDENETWSDEATVWAAIRGMPGREYLAGDKFVQEARAVFQIRWRAGVDPGMRLTYGGATYEIVSVTEIGRRQGLELLCVRRT